ncbi:MAG: murein L,D-transpeptidase catalytic domain family protein [Flavobacterium sp.]
MIYKFFPLIWLVLFTAGSRFESNEPTSVLAMNSATETTALSAKDIYLVLNPMGLNLPEWNCFQYGIEGFYRLKEQGKVKKNILTLIDFSISANAKRMWIIDMDSYTVLYQTLVSHGRNSGDEYAVKFSNKPESFQSSLGFYATAETYQGKHGLSLRLDGLERGINDKARERAIVIHGADYVSERFIQQNKRLGRSQGCPALPQELTKEIIELIKDQSCLFIYHPNRSYITQSRLVS